MKDEFDLLEINVPRYSLGVGNEGIEPLSSCTPIEYLGNGIYKTVSGDPRWAGDDTYSQKTLQEILNYYPLLKEGVEAQYEMYEKAVIAWAGRGLEEGQ